MRAQEQRKVMKMNKCYVGYNNINSELPYYLLMTGYKEHFKSIDGVQKFINNNYDFFEGCKMVNNNLKDTEFSPLEKELLLKTG